MHERCLIYAREVTDKDMLELKAQWVTFADI